MYSNINENFTYKLRRVYYHMQLIYNRTNLLLVNSYNGYADQANKVLKYVPVKQEISWL